jgi:VacB/RNase II family 3'-5' exoribonuclease
MNASNQSHRAILSRIAHRAMLDRGLLPDFSSEVISELGRLQAPTVASFNLPENSENIRDMRSLLWTSIDNDESRDLDQLTVGEALSSDKLKILVAIADVDTSIKNGSAIDLHARNNTTSVYTVAEIFPMLPENVSTNITSLNFDEDRLAIVVEMLVGNDGAVENSDIYRAWVRNHAKLAYNNVAAWLDGNGPVPEGVAIVKGLDENLRLQDKAAQHMKNLRHLHGALSLETIETKPVFDGDQIRSLEIEEKNRAKELIEDFMIAANGVTARYLSARNFPSIRRVVRSPKRWERIIEIAADHKVVLPAQPNSKALEEFLVKQKFEDPLRFPDLSLAIIKLLGAGEYIAELPEGNPSGHFGLSVKDYAHSTAPNRRYPDLLTQRLLKAALYNKPVPYSKEELDGIAIHCTEAEDAANKVERQVGKSAAALLLESRIGEQFDAIVTGASEKGTWVRLLTIPVEGKLILGDEGVDTGDRLRVQLVSVEIEKGYIDFKTVASNHGNR